MTAITPALDSWSSMRTLSKWQRRVLAVVRRVFCRVRCSFVLNVTVTEAQLIWSTTIWNFCFCILRHALKAVIFDLWTCLCVSLLTARGQEWGCGIIYLPVVAVTYNCDRIRSLLLRRPSLCICLTTSLADHTISLSLSLFLPAPFFICHPLKHLTFNYKWIRTPGGDDGAS